mgnify:CR=1 FL=1
MKRIVVLVLGILLAHPYAPSAQVHERKFESMGEVGLGLFHPTGSDGNFAKSSPVLQFVAGLGFSEHIGAEAEFLYVPILLKSSTLATSPFKKSWQLSVVAGMRLSTGRLVSGGQSAIGYLSMRAGFARIVTHTNTEIPSGSWIGRSIDKIENPGFGNFRITYKQKGFVLSPKVGSLVRLANNSAIDISFFPIFIFDRGEISRQYYFTLGFALSAWQSL